MLYHVISIFLEDYFWYNGLNPIHFPWWFTSGCWGIRHFWTKPFLGKGCDLHKPKAWRHHWYHWTWTPSVSCVTNESRWSEQDPTEAHPSQISSSLKVVWWFDGLALHMSDTQKTTWCSEKAKKITPFVEGEPYRNPPQAWQHASNRAAFKSLCHP